MIIFPVIYQKHPKTGCFFAEIGKSKEIIWVKGGKKNIYYYPVCYPLYYPLEYNESG